MVDTPIFVAIYFQAFILYSMALFLSCQTKLSVVAAERDFAMSEMHKMAEQCQTVAGEFEHMASHCEQLAKQLQQVCVCDYHMRVT